LFLTALVAIALVGFLRFGIGSPLASSASPAALPSPESAATIERSMPVPAASSGEDVHPGRVELILVGSR